MAGDRNDVDVVVRWPIVPRPRLAQAPLAVSLGDAVRPQITRSASMQRQSTALLHWLNDTTERFGAQFAIDQLEAALRMARARL